MIRYWIDIALEKSNEFLNDSSGAFLSAFSPKFKDYKTNADIYFQEGKFNAHLRFLDYLMDQTGNRGYLCSHAITVADLVWIAQLYKLLFNDHLRTTGKGHVLDSAHKCLSKFPKVQKWTNKMNQICKQYYGKMLTSEF